MILSSSFFVKLLDRAKLSGFLAHSLLDYSNLALISGGKEYKAGADLQTNVDIHFRCWGGQ